MPISKNILRKYLKYGKVFIETGTLSGQVVKNALSVGFERAYSIELSEYNYDVSKKNVGDDPRANLIFGDSAIELPKILNGIDEPCVIWLDAHFSGGTTAGEGVPAPLLVELEAIAKHPIKTHAILIDDVRIYSDSRYTMLDLEMFKDIEQGNHPNWPNVLNRLYLINKNYKLSLDDGFVKDDILVATV